MWVGKEEEVEVSEDHLFLLLPAGRHRHRLLPLGVHKSSDRVMTSSLSSNSSSSSSSYLAHSSRCSDPPHRHRFYRSSRTHSISTVGLLFLVLPLPEDEPPSLLTLSLIHI